MSILRSSSPRSSSRSRPLDHRRATLLLNRRHRWWAAGSAVATAALTAWYSAYARGELNGPSGGTVEGIVLGTAAYVFMIFCALLPVRRKLYTWRIGSVGSWVRAHIWIGLLTLPLVLFHCGFHVHGFLATILIWLYGIVMLSGFFGLYLQNVMPRVMTNQIEYETIYEQIPHVIGQLREEAEKIVAGVCGDLKPAVGAWQDAGPPDSGVTALRDFYVRRIDRFMRVPRLSSEDLAVPARAKALFAHLRKVTGPAHEDAVDDLEEICDERRQLEVQMRLHHWMHGWLFIHGPISFALLLLTAVHALIALAYSPIF